MILRKMTASFGRLENETLALQPGLNVLARPNEAGKSTWAAFLLAMLYGIDTAERAKQGVLPAKTKYKPWSGKPMQGTLELETDDGRRIRIERTSRGRTPMGEFAAYDLDTGLPVDGLTAENCGVTLLGVERSVFARSAFIHQASLALTADDALERRLSALVTTGDERASASAAAKLLREQKNKLQHNKTGLLPQALREKEQLENTLAQLREAHQEDLSLHARQDELTARRAQLATAQQALHAQEQEQKLAQLRAAHAQAQAAARACEQAQEKTRKYPARERLSALRRTLTELSGRPAAPLPDEPAAPACPAVFQGVAADQLMDKAQRDAREFDRLTAGKRPPSPVVPLVLAVLSAIFAARQSSWLIAVWIAIAAAWCAAAFFCWHIRRKRERRMEQAQALLAQYETRSRDEFTVFAVQYREQLLVYSQRRAAYDAAVAERQADERSRAEQLAKIFGAVSVFAPEAGDAPSALRALAQAEENYAALEAAQHALAVAQGRAEALEKAYGRLTPAAMPPGDWSDLDAAQLERETSQLERELQLVRSQLDQSQGRADALGDPAALAAQLEALDTQIAALRRRYAAVELAEQTLAAADHALQTRFAPQIAARAGEYFAALTENRYDRVLLDRQLQLSAGQTGEAGVRQLLSLSTGTADQLYLAARLAICDLLLPARAPLVLDDALLSFDDARMRAALQLLQAAGQQRQILLFSCHGREQAWLDGKSPRQPAALAAGTS